MKFQKCLLRACTALEIAFSLKYFSVAAYTILGFLLLDQSLKVSNINYDLVRVEAYIFNKCFSSAMTEIFTICLNSKHPRMQTCILL